MTLDVIIKELPLTSGVYLMKDIKGHVIYVGKAINLRRRVQSYFRKNHANIKTDLLLKHIKDIEVIQTHSQAEALILEASLIKKYQPKYNIELKDSKSYPYICITKEQFPLISIIRLAQPEQKKKDCVYFGPYTDATLIREALNVIRKIFPFRCCEILPKTACLYHDIGLCSAPCIGKISAQDYRRQIKYIMKVLRGEKDSLYRDLTQQMQKAAQEKRFEQAGLFRDQLRAIGALYSSNADVNHFKEIEQLQLMLNLERLPQRIECIDISTTMGIATVGSLVSFLNGKPDKTQYRKFRIKDVSGIDDFQSVAEVVRRRYSRLKREQKTYPDLLMIDGGLGQLHAAQHVLKTLDISIPLISLAKKEEIVFAVHKKKPIVLSKDSLALKLLQRIRDEAHRFAITYHRFLRSKKTLEA